MWEAISGTITALAWLAALVMIGLGAFDLFRAFYGGENISAVQEAAGGILGIGEAVIAYVFARAIDTILTATRK